MTKMGNTRLIAIIIIAALALAACQSPATETPEAPAQEPAEYVYNPADSLPLRLAVTRPAALNPLFNGNDSLYQLYHLVYESLITYDEHFNIEPLLAESWEVDGTGSSVTFHLRENVTWHDGEPFTPEDVVFTFQVMREMMSSLTVPNLYTNNLQQVSDVRKTGDHSVRFTFTRPYSNALETLVFPILPQHRFTGSNRNLLRSDQFPLIGTGRYTVEAYDASRSILLRYYPAYWGRKPYIEEIEVTIVPDMKAKLSLFESGEIDLTEPQMVDWVKLSDQDRIKGATYPSTRYEFIGFNFRRECWQQKALRQAVAAAVDYDALLKTIYFGHGARTHSPVHPASWLYQQEIDLPVHDPENARSLIESAAIPEGTVFTLLTNEGNPLRKKTAEMIAVSLTEAGMEVEVELADWETLQRRLENGEFDMVLTGWHFSMIPDLSFAFHSTQEEMGNFIGYQSERMDQLLEAAFAAPGRQQKEAAWHEIQQHLTDEMPYVSLLFKEFAVLYRTTLRGELAPTQHNIFRGIETAYMIPDREEAASNGGD